MRFLAGLSTARRQQVRMFHVKHAASHTAPTLAPTDATAEQTAPVFHVKRRRTPLLVAAVFLGLFSTACFGIQEPEGWAAPVETNGGLVVQVSRGLLAQVDPSNGAAAWRYPTDDDDRNPYYATPIVDGSRLYVVDYRGRAARLDLSAGQPREDWVLELDAQVVATPLLRNGILYIPTESGRIEVVDADQGLLTRTLQTDDRRIWGSPAATSSTIFVGDLDNGVTVAFDLSTGELLWQQEISGPSAADLALDGDLLLVGAFDQHIHALEVTRSGEERWAFQGDGWSMAEPLVRQGVVYAVTMNGFVYALDRDSGAEIWSFAEETAEFRAAPVIVGNSLVAVARDGRVFALRLADGVLQWSQDVIDGGDVNGNALVSGTDLFIITSEHNLVRVDVATSGAFQNVPLAAAR